MSKITVADLKRADLIRSRIYPSNFNKAMITDMMNHNNEKRVPEELKEYNKLYPNPYDPDTWLVSFPSREQIACNPWRKHLFPGSFPEEKRELPEPIKQKRVSILKKVKSWISKSVSQYNQIDDKDERNILYTDSNNPYTWPRQSYSEMRNRMYQQKEQERTNKEVESETIYPDNSLTALHWSNNYFVPFEGSKTLRRTKKHYY